MSTWTDDDARGRGMVHVANPASIPSRSHQAASSIVPSTAGTYMFSPSQCTG